MSPDSGAPGQLIYTGRGPPICTGRMLARLPPPTNQAPNPHFSGSPRAHPLTPYRDTLRPAQTRILPRLNVWKCDYTRCRIGSQARARPSANLLSIVIHRAPMLLIRRDRDFKAVPNREPHQWTSGLGAHVYRKVFVINAR